MTISPDGLAFICGFEQLRTLPYLPTPADRPTIGYGMTYYPGGKAVTMADAALTAGEALAMFTALIGDVEAQIRSLVTRPVTQGQWDALMSLAYNIGTGHFEASTVLRDLNSGDIHDAANAFLLWDKQAGHVLKGLVARRRAERTMFLQGDA